MKLEMEKDSALFPSIPVSTVRAARALYGRGNLYLRLGDHLNQLVSKLNLATRYGHLDEENAALYTLITIIQHVEKLTDTELADAIQRRMDLRYALHLATPNHRMDPQSFCLFRSKVLADADYRTLFEELFKHIYPEINPTATREATDIDSVLHSICENEMRSSLMEAMLNAMEALSANHYRWLRGIALPYWYQRYNRSLILTHVGDYFRKQELNRDDLKKDIQHLLSEIRASNIREIIEMPEIKKLILVWEHLTGPPSVKNCMQCIKHID